MLTSDVPDPQSVLPCASTHTPPRVLSLPVSKPTTNKPSVLSGKQRVASFDLRIGLHLLGHEGRKLLAEYISNKRQLEQHTKGTGND